MNKMSYVFDANNEVRNENKQNCTFKPTICSPVKRQGSVFDHLYNDAKQRQTKQQPQ